MSIANYIRASAYLFLIILFLDSVVVAQSGWFALNSGTTFNITDIQFLNQNTGYISSPARKTTDGGNSWFSVGVSSGNGLFFLSVNVGYLVGYNGYIRRTTNGGVSWFSTLPLPYPTTLFEVYFINASTGMIVGGLQQNYLGAFYYSTDNGNSWSDRSPSIAFDREIYDVYFFDANTGIVVTTFSVMKTTNAGFNWITTENSGNLETAVSFASPSLGLVVGVGSRILRTTNGGDNWTLVYSTGSGIFRDVILIDTNNAVVVGSGGRILRSTNGGLNWISQSSGTTRTLRAVHFIDANSGWACGDTGTLLKTTTGGFTGIEPISNETPNSFKLHQNYPNPFNPISKIKYQIAKINDVKLTVFDALGREITTLVNEELKPGTYEIEFDGSNYPSGIYLYRLTAGDYAETKKMVLLK